MSFSELNSVEQTDIQKLSGVNLNPSDQVLLEGELREASIRINPRFRPAQDQAVIATGAVIAFAGLRSTPKPDRLEA